MKLNAIIKSNVFWGFLTALTCLSFCASGWYYSRGSQILVQNNFPPFSHELCAFLMAGVIPSIIFEFVARMFSFRKKSYRVVASPYAQHSRSGYDASPPDVLEALISSERKKMATLRIFLIAANFICFGLSFIYFSNRILFVWGRILLNFVVSLIFFALFLVFQARKTQKNATGYMIMQTGRIYMTAYCAMVLIELAFSFALI